MSLRRTAFEPSPSSLATAKWHAASHRTPSRPQAVPWSWSWSWSSWQDVRARPPPSICQGGRRFLPQSRIGPGAQTENDSQTRIGHDDTTLAWRQRASASTGGPAQSPEHTSDQLPCTTAYDQTSPRRVRGLGARGFGAVIPAPPAHWPVTGGDALTHSLAHAHARRRSTEYGAAHAAPSPPQMRGRVDNTTTNLEMCACTKGLCLCL
ncbi:hypothetical protein CCMA1212_001715 [Trichoderma ghanense]|uniref:Uncharacterized protein n=1 Tax=Trichoderma ghanense TaxID=65468 RepID=A0ABY2HD50_9HYPO